MYDVHQSGHIAGACAEAVERYDKALELEPANSKVWNNKAMALTDMCKYCKALECLNKSLLLDPANAKAWNNNGATLSKLGWQPEADE